MIKKLFSLFAAVLFAGSMMAGALELYTLDATDSGNQGTNNSYAGDCDIAVGVITWNVTGNSTMSPWRIGGKNLNGVDREVYSKTAFSSALDSIVLEIGAASSVTINSIKLTHSLNADFTSGTELTAATKAPNSSIKFAPAGGFPANSYFKVTFNVTITAKSGNNYQNKFIEFKKLHFWGQAPSIPEISCANTLDFGVVYGKAPAASKTLEVAAYNLTEDIEATLETGARFALPTSTLDKEGGDFVVNFSASTSDDFSDNLTLSSGEAEKVVALSAVAVKTEHEGTTADPFIVDEVRAIAFAHADGETTKDSMSITGPVKSVIEVDDSRVSFSIGAGNDTVVCYRTCDANGQKTLNANSVHVGDVVVVRGKLQNYKPSTKNIAQIGYGRLLSVSSTVPEITLASYSLNIPAAAKTAEIEVTYANVDASEAHIAFFEADGTTPTTADTYDWLTVSINGSNNVAYTAEANESTTDSRSAYFKVYVEDEDVYSDLVTITQAKYVIDYADLPFAFDGNGSGVASVTGLTQNGVGDYASSPKLKFDGTGDWVILKINEDAGVLAFDIKGNSFSGGTFTVQTSEDGETYTDLKAYTDLGDTQTEIFKIAADVRYIKWIYTEKENGNVGLGNISVSKDTYEIKWSLGAGADENLGVLGKMGDSDSYAKYFDKEILNAGTYDVKLYKNGAATPIATTTLEIEQEEAMKYYLQFDYNASTSEFTATASNPRAATSVDNTELSNKAVKFIENGQLFIELNGHVYNLQGQVVK